MQADRQQIGKKTEGQTGMHCTGRQEEKQASRKEDRHAEQRKARQARWQADRHTVQTERRASKQVGSHTERQEVIYKQRLTFIMYAVKKENKELNRIYCEILRGKQTKINQNQEAT
jgi:hypothetical protein